MIEFDKLVLFITLSTIICATPGPTVLFTLSNGLSGNRRKAIIGLFGTASANIVWILCCAIGVATFIKDSLILFMSLKYAGAIYLFYLGILSFKNKSTVTSKLHVGKNIKNSSAYYQGFLTTITNPKALIYYMAFFPQFVSRQASYSLELLCLGICYIIIMFLVLGGYIVASGKVASLFKRQGFHQFFNKVLGVGFIGASASVIASK